MIMTGKDCNKLCGNEKRKKKQKKKKRLNDSWETVANDKIEMPMRLNLEFVFSFVRLSLLESIWNIQISVQLPNNAINIENAGTFVASIEM